MRPFSFEEMTSSNYGTFMERGLPNALVPSRSTGFGVFDRYDGRITWGYGVFRDTASDGDGARLGALEATMMLVYGAIAGNPTPGITAALILRFRELAWTSLSLAIAAGLHVSPRSVAADRSQPKN